ncbi:MAG: helix-turn-helix domain-containing protein [Gemmatimonadota bacterium]
MTAPAPIWKQALEQRRAKPLKPAKAPTGEPLRALLLARGVLWLIEAAGNHYGVTLEEMFSHIRPHRVCVARHHAWWELRQRGYWSYPDIGKLFGRDHTTIMAGVQSHERRRLAP